MTIQYLMLVLLGFLIASFIALLVAPAFWSRAVRLTTQRLRQSLPLTETEILADKDQLRAKYAMRVHQLEKQLEQASLGGARQKIELNRRDAAISTLESEVSVLQAQHEEAQNAKRVLEQTVSDRLPRVETRLEEARKLLIARDRDVGELTQSTRRHREALGEARGISQKQANEIERLKTQLLSNEAQSRRGPRNADYEGELALRAELESLRSRVRDQSSLIDRLNAEVSAGRLNSAALDPRRSRGTSKPGEAAALLTQHIEQGVLVEQLRRDLMEAQAALKQASGIVDTNAPAATPRERAHDKELQALKARIEDQSSEIARLNAELASTQGAGEGEARGVPTLRDNRVALKAKVGGLEAKVTQQSDTIQRLRAEIASANERSARQAAQFMGEMRSLGLAAHVNASRTGRPDAALRSRTVAKRAAAVLETPRAGAVMANAVMNGAAAQGSHGGGSVSQRLGPQAAGREPIGLGNDPGASPSYEDNGRVRSLLGALRGDPDAPTHAATPADHEAPDSQTPASANSTGATAEPRSRLLDRLSSSGEKS